MGWGGWEIPAWLAPGLKQLTDQPSVLYQNRNQTETKYTVLLRMGCKTEIICYLAGCWAVAVVVWMSVPTFVMNTAITFMETKTYRASGFYWRQTLTINRPEAKILQLWSRIHQRMTFLIVLYSQWNRLLGVEREKVSHSSDVCHTVVRPTSPGKFTAGGDGT